MDWSQRGHECIIALQCDIAIQCSAKEPALSEDVSGPEGRKPEGRCRPRSCVAKQGLERYGDCNSPGSGAPNRATLLARIGKGQVLPGREGGRVRYLGGYATVRKSARPGGPIDWHSARVLHVTASPATRPIPDCRLSIHRPLPPTVQVACRWGRWVEPWGFGGVG